MLYSFSAGNTIHSFKCYSGLSLFHCKLLFSCHFYSNTMLSASQYFSNNAECTTLFSKLLRKFLFSLYNYFLGGNITLSCTVVDSPCASEVENTAMASAPRPGATHLATKVELTISCNNLMDMDVFSKSDPLCALYINTSGSHWHEVCTSRLE